ncbi:polyprenyl synthetase family protein [Nocardioides plantarum]|uniref:Polyprenyl synthetase family protein n=1 Tax=Nocardioides plantarum TaxID=29299 RepID=A0ABV5KG61_9ACTN|nr:polyprenyl synthetase family protein [Nocardioides plantarum]
MDVDRLLDGVRERLRTPPSCGVARVDLVVLDALRPGKLLRPDLVVRSAAAALSEPRHAPELDDHVVSGALAVELLHVATLVHDDIIDAAPLRRGRPSVVAAAGTGTAIVVGDLLLARGAAAAADSSVAAAGVWAGALEQMAAGQLREEDLAAAPSVAAHADYIALKTAALFRASAEIGALAVGADPVVVDAHGRFGHHFGMAFQHVDDLLDTIGDPAHLGKPVGADRANGVPTAVALVGQGLSSEVTALVVDEIAAAGAAVERSPGGVALLQWAADALQRALLTALDDDGRQQAAPLVAALDDAVRGRAGLETARPV